MTFTSFLVDYRPIESLTMLFIAAQVFLIRKQTSKDHERSRRVRALDDIKWFVGQIRPEHHRISKILDELPADSIDALRSTDPQRWINFKVPVRFKEDMERILSSRISPDKLEIHVKDGFLELSQSQVTALRSVTMGYLNIIETVLAPIYAGVSDRDIIKNQMKGYFFHFETGKPKCALVRQAWGKGDLPASLEFAEELQNELTVGMVNKKKLL